MPSSKESHQGCAISRSIPQTQAQLKQAGLRASALRVAVLQWLHRQSGPRTHTQVLAGIDSSKAHSATVYRNLIALSDAGLLRKLTLSDGQHFEPAHGHGHDDDHHHHHHDHAPPKNQPEPQAAPHAAPNSVVAPTVHFVCITCNTIQCLSLPVPKHWSGALDGAIHTVEIRGPCNPCLAASGAKSAP